MTKISISQELKPDDWKTMERCGMTLTVRRQDGLVELRHGREFAVARTPAIALSRLPMEHA